MGLLSLVNVPVLSLFNQPAAIFKPKMKATMNVKTRLIRLKHFRFMASLLIGLSLLIFLKVIANYFSAQKLHMTKLAMEKSAAEESAVDKSAEDAFSAHLKNNASLTRIDYRYKPSCNKIESRCFNKNTIFLCRAQTDSSENMPRNAVALINKAAKAIYKAVIINSEFGPFEDKDKNNVVKNTATFENIKHKLNIELLNEAIQNESFFITKNNVNDYLVDIFQIICFGSTNCHAYIDKKYFENELKPFWFDDKDRKTETKELFSYMRAKKKRIEIIADNKNAIVVKVTTWHKNGGFVILWTMEIGHNGKLISIDMVEEKYGIGPVYFDI